MWIEGLERAGIDYEEGLNRFAGKVELYEKYLLRYPEEQIFTDLSAAMLSGDYEEAFKKAHALKGVAGNLSLNRFLAVLREFVECLRDGRDIERARELFPGLECQQEEIVSVIREAGNRKNR